MRRDLTLENMQALVETTKRISQEALSRKAQGIPEPPVSLSLDNLVLEGDDAVRWKLVSAMVELVEGHTDMPKQIDAVLAVGIDVAMDTLGKVTQVLLAMQGLKEGICPVHGPDCPDMQDMDDVPSRPLPRKAAVLN
jgi:hypothetical protein